MLILVNGGHDLTTIPFRFSKPLFEINFTPMIAARLKSSFDKYFDAPAGVVGTGYELWRGRFALDVQGRAQVGSIAAPESRRNGLVFNLLVGVNWH